MSSGTGADARKPAARRSHAKPQAATGDAAHRAVGAARALRWVGLIGIASIALLRCMIVFAPQVAFDTDPAFDQTSLGGLGPAGSLALDALLLLACAAALAGEWLAGRSINLWLCALAGLPAPIIIWHALRGTGGGGGGAAGDAGDLWHGSTWLAAMCAAVAAAHLARERSMRLLLLALLAAALAPLLVRGAAQMFHEHPATVRYYLEHRPEILAGRGLELGSPAAAIYERRLLQAEPTGWFTTTNIFASLAGFATVLCAGLTLAARRTRMESGWWFMMLLFAGCAAAGLALTGSKGGLLATAAGLALLVAPLALRGVRPRWPRLAGPMLIALASAALVGVIIRGTVLPESFMGDKSLLFRWHYLIGATRMIMQQPLTGVGPDGFQEAYVLHRVPRSPEEVSSAHSMFVDWLAALGPAGIAWIAVAIVLLGRIGSCDTVQWAGDRARTWAGRDPPALVGTTGFTPILWGAALAFAPAILIEWPTLDNPLNLTARVMGALAFIVAATMLYRVLAAIDPHVLCWAWAAAIAALLVHGQIEMTFTQPGSAAWAMTALGVGAGGALRLRMANPARPATEVAGPGGWASRGAIGAVAPLALAALALWLALAHVIPACRQQQLMMQAAAALEPVGANPQDQALARQRRRIAADLLVAAYEAWPLNVQPLEAAATQLQLAPVPPFHNTSGAHHHRALLDALALLERAVREHDRLSSIAQAANLRERLFILAGGADHLRAAIELARELAQRDPQAITSWKRLGDLLWRAGDTSAAADAYARALAADRSFELDSAKQLTAPDRALIESRIAAGQEPPGTPDGS